MSKKKNKKVNDGGSEKKDSGNAEVAKEQQKVEEAGGKGNQKSEEGQKKENNGGGGNAVLLKTDLHCEGCANKVFKFTRGFSGVEHVKVDFSSGKITVNGEVDPVELREKLEQKTHKKVELLSPVPKKDKENAKGKDGSSDGKGDKNKDSKDQNKSGKDEKAPKEPPVTTAVLKVSLHCEGCIHKIHRIVTKTKGLEEINIDKQKDLVTVKGRMDVKALAENLKKHLKRAVEIVPPKKDEKKEKGGGGGGGGGGGEAKSAAVAAALAAAAANGGGGDGGVERMEGNKMQVQQFGQQFGYGVAPPAYGYPTPSPYMYGGPTYVGDPYQFQYHAPQMFSDENPNACSVM